MNGGAYVHEKTERHISWSAECASLVGFDRALAFEPNLILVGLCANKWLNLRPKKKLKMFNNDQKGFSKFKFNSSHP